MRSHTCRLLSRLVVKVGPDGAFQLAEVRKDYADFARLLTEALAVLPSDDPARAAAEQALGVLTAAVSAAAPAAAAAPVAAPVKAPAAGAGSLKRVREE